MTTSRTAHQKQKRAAHEAETFTRTGEPPEHMAIFWGAFRDMCAALRRKALLLAEEYEAVKRAGNLEEAQKPREFRRPSRLLFDAKAGESGVLLLEWRVPKGYRDSLGTQMYGTRILKRGDDGQMFKLEKLFKKAPLWQHDSIRDVETKAAQLRRASARLLEICRRLRVLEGDLRVMGYTIVPLQEISHFRLGHPVVPARPVEQPQSTPEQAPKDSGKPRPKPIREKQFPQPY